MGRGNGWYAGGPRGWTSFGLLSIKSKSASSGVKHSPVAAFAQIAGHSHRFGASSGRPLPAQDTPPLTDRQRCLTRLDPAPKTETQGQKGETASEKLPNSGGVVCPPAEINREILITPPGESEILVPPPGNSERSIC